MKKKRREHCKGGRERTESLCRIAHFLRAEFTREQASNRVMRCVMYIVLDVRAPSMSTSVIQRQRIFCFMRF